MWSKRVSQLSDAQRESVRRSSGEGVSKAQLAERYGVTRLTIHRIVKEKNKGDKHDSES